MARYKSNNTGVLLVGHGSRDAKAMRAFERLAEQFKAQLPAPHPVAHGYLEFASPILTQAVQSLKKQGCETIYALPVMLFAAGHVKNDVPSALRQASQTHKVTIHMGRELGFDYRLLKLSCQRIEDALAQSKKHVAKDKTLLMVVGRGSSDPDANANIGKVARLLLENTGLGWVETAYSGVTFPLTKPALMRARQFGFARIILFPYFLFTGILIERIYQHAQEVAQTWTEGEIINASYLDAHPLVTETLLDRLKECKNGTGLMNCHLCKYRVPLPSFEQEVGEPQVGHHHHVEGLLDGHHHAHHHHARSTYPHHDHPLGPLSLKNSS